MPEIGNLEKLFREHRSHGAKQVPANGSQNGGHCRKQYHTERPQNKQTTAPKRMPVDAKIYEPSGHRFIRYLTGFRL